MKDKKDETCKMQDYGRDYERQLEVMSPFEIKNELISYARNCSRQSAMVFLNAGRGNPNWVNTMGREAFMMIGQFGMQECRRVHSEPSVGLAGIPSSEGIGDRFKTFLACNYGSDISKFLERAYDYLVAKGYDADDLVYEWASGVVGDQYPSPDRILPFTEKIIVDYLNKELSGGNLDRKSIEMELFATEGGTAAMCYLFSSLKNNRLLRKGDKIALMTPIFTPYIEIPELEEFGFEVVEINADKKSEDGYHTWQYPDEELEKLRDTDVKLLCLVNPSNPPSYALDVETREKIVKIVSESNPNLMIITDDVYGTFVDGFQSLMYLLPRNTACVYSFSKYFGCTGWRLAVVGVSPNNVFDELLSSLSKDDKDELTNRYRNISLHPSEMKFIDRMVADSRLVALNHTAGLSTPQQIQMSMFAMFSLMDVDETYRSRMCEIIGNRLTSLWQSTGFKLLKDPNRAGYYSEIDVLLWADKLYGGDFSKWLKQNYEPLDFVIRLAKETGVVLLNGGGFDAPEWSVRVSLANLMVDDYVRIGEHIGKMLEEYACVWYSGECKR